MSSLRALVAIALGLLLGACAVSPGAPPSPPQEILRDELFAPLERPIDAAEVFAFTPAMQRFLDGPEFAAQRRSKGLRQGLIDALYSKSMLKIEYDSTVTRNAAEAFEARSGNCMSLVLMTAAFAKRLDLPVRFRNVYVDEAWSRSGDLYFLTGHVNLSLGMPLHMQRGTAMLADELTIDFVPAEMIRGQRAREIEEATIVAMYMNNRAAEHLHDGRTNEAYWWAREALLTDPKYTGAYNTLGVVYRRHGQSAAAERALRHVLAQEPGNTQSLSNLILVLKDQGRRPEAERLSAQLSELQPYPPFRFFDMGLQAMKGGDFEKARELFAKEIARSAYFHEFHFWMALANYGLGDFAQARKHMGLAAEHSTTRKDRELYAAKLGWLKTQRNNLH
jgi:Tfp pilus assembly protein PilF